MKISDFIAEVDARIGSSTVLTTPDKQRLVKQAIRHYATYNPPITHQSIAYSGADYIDLPSSVKRVLNVYPGATSGGVGTAEEFLFGFTPIPEDLDQYWLSRQYLQQIRSVGSYRLAWKQVGTQLFIEDAGSDVTAVTLFYYGKIDETADPDITGQDAVEWLIGYSTALCKIAEGTRLRPAGMLGVDTPGADLVSDGKDEKKELEETLQEQQMPLPIRRHSGS